MRRFTTPLVLASAALITAGGYIHLREWLETYRDVPSEAPGAFIVRIGFPLNAAVSLLLAIALVATVFVVRRFQPLVVASAFLFQAGSLAVLIGTRIDTVFGWTEPGWTTGASQTRAVEIAAMMCLPGALVLHRSPTDRASVPRPMPA